MKMQVTEFAQKRRRRRREDIRNKQSIYHNKMCLSTFLSKTFPDVFAMFPYLGTLKFTRNS
jgi:hypothetical protein